MWYEVLAWILLAPLLAIIEFAATFIFDKIETKSKWHPFQDKYNKTLQDANETNFFMIIEPDNKASILVGIIGFGFMWVAGVAAVFAAYLTGQMKFVDCILTTLVFGVICLPFCSVFLHYFTKKIYFSAEAIFIKSVFIKKEIKFSDVDYVNEELAKTHRSFTSPNIDILIIYLQKGKIKITKNYSNYELAKTRFVNMNLLRNSF